MACYTCMEAWSMIHRQIMCCSTIGHAIVCWLLLLQIRCTKHGWLTALEVVTKLGDKMVWNSTAQPQGPCHTIVVNKKKLASHKPQWAHNTLCWPISTPYVLCAFVNIQWAMHVGIDAWKAMEVSMQWFLVLCIVATKYLVSYARLYQLLQSNTCS